MDILEQAKGTYTILRVQGDFLCEDEKPALRESIQRALTAGTKYIILDLSSVMHMNSCGLGSLVSCMTTMRKTGGDFVLLAPTENVSYLLSITKLNQIFSIYPNLEKAIENFQ